MDFRHYLHNQSEDEPLLAIAPGGETWLAEHIKWLHLSLEDFGYCENKATTADDQAKIIPIPTPLVTDIISEPIQHTTKIKPSLSDVVICSLLASAIVALMAVIFFNS